MRPSEYARAAGLFVLVVAVIVGGTAVVGSLRTPAPTDLGTSAPDQFQPNSSLVTVGPQEGTVDVEAGADTRGKTVLIDRSHGNDVTRSEMSALVKALVENGYEVEFYGSGDRPGRDLNASLREADAFVVLNPTAQFEASEVRGIEAFVEGGGRLLLMADPSSIRASFFFVESVEHDPTNLASEFGVGFGTGYLYNMNTERRANNYQSIYARPTAESELTDGVERVVVRDAAPVRVGPNATPLVIGAEGTRLSTTREAGTYPVAARNGNVTAVGDTSLLSNGNAYDADNEALLANLVEFLVTGEKGPCAPPKADEGPTRAPRPPAEGDRPGSDEGTTTPSEC